MQKSVIPELPELAVENFNMGLAARVAQAFVLEEIYLVQAKISRDPLSMFPEVLSLEHKCSTEIFSPETDKIDFLVKTDQDGKKLLCILCNFQVAAFNDKTPGKLVMKIEASFCTSYFIVKPVPDDLRPEKIWEYLFTINPISNAWPYWREFVQGMSTRMGLPALTVPLLPPLKITPKKSEAKELKIKPVKIKSTPRKKLSA